MTEARGRQLAYSQQQALMLDEVSRRAKAGKIARVIEHFLGTDLAGLHILDIGSSAGIIAAELQARGARVIGSDIDVPALTSAQARFGDRVAFLCADGERLPLADSSVDVVVLNHIYEHVVSPAAVVAEIRRVLRPTGLVYLGLGNRLGVVEPHYGLPFLSWLPRPLAHRYVRASGRASHYHERFLTRAALARLFGAFDLWDYTLCILAEPPRFGAEDAVKGAVRRLPHFLLRAAMPLIPTYVWVGAPTPRQPLGPPTAIPPARVHRR